MLAIGAVVAATATSIYIFHTRSQRNKRPRRNQGNKDNASATTDSNNLDGESDFYRQLGISEENLPTHIQREIHKERQRKAKVELISMKTPMYDNVFMLDTNRNPLCTISMKKARWYLKKGIAEWSSFKDGQAIDGGGEGEVQCLRLLFEHNGSSEEKAPEENLYLQSAKQNVCVCCGSNGHHIRHYIVPYTYRTLLPAQYKSHMSHDIIILCPDCHVDCERITKKRMKRIEQDLRMKSGAYNTSAMIDNPELNHIRSCAIALVKWRDSMPEEKVASHEKDVREYLASQCKKEEDKEAMLNGAEELTKSQLQKACSVNYRVRNPDFIPGSDVVVRSLNEDPKCIEEFIIDWRKHFISTVNPQHMPTGWRIENPVVCGARKEDGDDGVRSW